MREAESGRLVFAPVLLRASAVLIDLAILVVLGLGVSALLGDTQLKQRETYAVVVVMAAVYNVAFLATRSATPGKDAVRRDVGGDGAGTADRGCLISPPAG